MWLNMTRSDLGFALRLPCLLFDKGRLFRHGLKQTNILWVLVDSYWAGDTDTHPSHTPSWGSPLVYFTSLVDNCSSDWGSLSPSPSCTVKGGYMCLSLVAGQVGGVQSLDSRAFLIFSRVNIGKKLNPFLVLWTQNLMIWTEVPSVVKLRDQL